MSDEAVNVGVTDPTPDEDLEFVNKILDELLQILEKTSLDISILNMAMANYDDFKNRLLMDMSKFDSDMSILKMKVEYLQ